MRDPEETVQDPASEVVQADAEAGTVDLGEDPVQRPPATPATVTSIPDLKWEEEIL